MFRTAAFLTDPYRSDFILPRAIKGEWYRVFYIYIYIYIEREREKEIEVQESNACT